MKRDGYSSIEEDSVNSAGGSNRNMRLYAHASSTCSYVSSSSSLLSSDPEREALLSPNNDISVVNCYPLSF